MKKKHNNFTLFILTIVVLVLSASCINFINTVSEAKSVVKNSVKLNQNKIQFDMDLKNGTLVAKAVYLRKDLPDTKFLLNRDFIVKEIICDGKEIEINKIKKSIKLEDDYLVNLYELPDFKEELQINYTGVLSGDTGSSPYVKEKISEDFTFLRFETYCYPVFAGNNEGIFKFLDMPLKAELTVNVPNGYTALTPFELVNQTENSKYNSFVYDADSADISCAIAKYKKVSLSSGEFYFLENMNIDKVSKIITPIMNSTQQYMNTHFGKVKIPKKMKYVTIPNHFGSFAITGKTVYIEKGAFKSTSKMAQLIHEFIHLGWNAKPKAGEVQRARFFDEGFTSYFTIRVLAELLGEDYYASEIKRYEEIYKTRISEDKNQFVPITDYGKYEIGDLSYATGPLLFDQLCNLVGVKTFDNATKKFLKKYRNTPVDFETMSKEYIKLCDNPELESFFDDWLFTTNGYKQYID